MEKKEVIESYSQIEESKQVNNSSLNDAAFGCVLGALMGDASGTFLEFSQQVINKQSVELSMRMPGGGPHKVAPGQITDDGELTISLLNGLVNGKGLLNLRQIVVMYSKWIQSKPFDIGGTIRHSFFKCDQKNPNPLRVIKAAKQKKSVTSQSNGSLMRITPLAVWTHRLSDEDLEQAVRVEVSLSHSDKVVQDAAVCYCLAIKYILNKLGTRAQAYEHCRQWTNLNSNKPGQLYDWFQIIEGFTDFQVNTEIVTPKKAGGWARHSFILGFNFLRQENIDYNQAIFNTLILGGDTDTNACIVGGLIGACCGMSNLPQEQLKQVLNCDISKGSKSKRPKFLQVKENTLALLEELIGMCPSKLEIKY